MLAFFFFFLQIKIPLSLSKLLGELRVYSFLLLTSIPWFGYTSFLNHSLNGLLPVWTLKNIEYYEQSCLDIYV